MQEHPQHLKFIIRTRVRKERIEQLDKPANLFAFDFESHLGIRYAAVF